ncbi:MAG: 4Fe-4S ferredoxin [Gammaproteobacteria bacterium]|nr:4Fe-4S ferredoxin [Gammaproteobacteria bacterium]
MKPSVTEINKLNPDSRREFLKNLLSGATTATVLMVYGPRILARPGADTRFWKEKSTEREWAYVIDINKCIGCGSCVRACKQENNVPATVFRTWVERYVITDEGVYVDSPDGALEGFEEVNAEIRDHAKTAFFVPKMCNHCAEPPCVQACPVGATFKSPEGFVLNDETHCLGCGYCVQACPYGARFINPEKHVSDKCTWCYHRVQNGKLPACVEACPNKARLFGDLKDPESEVARIFLEDKWMILKDMMHTEPYCFYIGLRREVL